MFKYCTIAFLFNHKLCDYHILFLETRTIARARAGTHKCVTVLHARNHSISTFVLLSYISGKAEGFFTENYIHEI